MYGDEMNGLEKLEEKIEQLNFDNWEPITSPLSDPDFDLKCEDIREGRVRRY